MFLIALLTIIVLIILAALEALNPNRGETQADAKDAIVTLDGMELAYFEEMHDFRTRLRVSDTVEVSLTTDDATLFNIAILNTDAERFEDESRGIDFVTTYHNDPVIEELADQIAEATGFDTSGPVYGLSASDASKWMRKLRVFFAN